MNEYEIEQPARGHKKILLLAVALIVVAALVVIVYYFTKVNRAASSESHEVHFVVQKGSSTRQIAEQLGQEKIISSPWVFITYATLHKAGGKIQAGDYQLNSNMPITDIMDVLTHGRVVSTARNLTIIEGWTNKQVGSYLQQRGITNKDTDLNDLFRTQKFTFKYSATAEKFGYQGFLFPDTYKLGRDEDATVLVQKMLKNFETKLANQTVTDDQLILASIIEKEVGRNKSVLTADDLAAMQHERELVASVFYNRLAAGMPLESDATVNYITGKADRSVSIADTKIKSPYNTYQVKGLPPTPISNPGLGSIQAAITPAQSDYLYFLNAPDGTAYFAKTLAEHNTNKAKYLK